MCIKINFQLEDSHLSWDCKLLKLRFLVRRLWFFWLPCFHLGIRIIQWSQCVELHSRILFLLKLTSLIQLHSCLCSKSMFCMIIHLLHLTNLHCFLIWTIYPNFCSICFSKLVWRNYHCLQALRICLPRNLQKCYGL